MVIVTSAVGPARDAGTPQETSTGSKESASVAAPSAAERNPASVTPTCRAARKVLGLATRRSTALPRRP